MALTRALVDEARRVFAEQEPTEWIDGEPSFGTKHGPWFRCRLTVRQPREEGQFPRTTFLAGDAELLFGVRDREGGRLWDPDGDFVGWDADEELEVHSRQLGTHRWRINTGVEPIRKRRTVIGGRVGLSRVSEPSVDVG